MALALQALQQLLGFPAKPTPLGSFTAEHGYHGALPADVKLSYFDFKGKGEPIRLTLHMMGVPFEDHRVGKGEWEAFKRHTLFGQMPQVEMDGLKWAQTNAILRYLGKVGGLYPSDAREALACDMVLEFLDDITNAVTKTFGLAPAAMAKARRELLPKLRGMLERLEGLLANGGASGYFCPKGCTVADVNCMCVLEWLAQGVLDGIPTDIIEAYPGLVTHQAKVNALHPVIDWKSKHT